MNSSSWSIQFASDWFAAHQGEWRENTRLDYRWQLTHHVLPFFKGHRLSEITIAEVDRYRQFKVREAKLSASSINKTITRLAQILELAVEYGYLDRNPAAGRRRHLKVDRPQRSYLDTSDQIAALLDAAGTIDRQTRSDRPVARRAMLATLVFAGLRIGELLALRWCDVDLATGRLRVGKAKTDAGVRQVDLLPILRDELAAHKAAARNASPRALVFATATGRPHGASNLRRRVLARAVDEANARLDEQGQSPLPDGLTPHSLRRTCASVLFALGRAAPDVMEQLGHTDPKLTLRIYARAMRRGKERQGDFAN
jgi:integrase